MGGGHDREERVLELRLEVLENYARLSNTKGDGITGNTSEMMPVHLTLQV